MNDIPHPDAGLAQVWAFAHPDNKLVTSPFVRFAQMIKSKAYRILIGHRSHNIELVSETDKEALFTVSVTASDGKVYGYRWNVEKVLSSNFSGAWLTSAVSAPMLPRGAYQIRSLYSGEIPIRQRASNPVFSLDVF